MSDTRRWPRIDLALEVRLRFDSMEHAIEAHATNFSREGIFVAMVEPRPIGALVRVKLQVANERYTLEGVVVRSVSALGEASPEAAGARGVAVFLTSASAGWGRFCDRLARGRKAQRA